MAYQRYELTAGNLKNLHLKAIDLPDPGPGEVQIAVKSVGLNFADIFAIWGLYSATPKGNFTPGLEYAGTIVKTGEGETDFKVGDRVMGISRFGAYTEGLNQDARYIFKIPGNWSFDEGAAYLVQTITAYYALKNLGDLQKGQTVLVHSAAGGVGIQAVKICKHYGAYTIGTVGSPAKVDFAKAEGYDEVIVRDENFETKLKNALGERALHLVLDSIGGEFFKIPFKIMTPMGRIVVYGSARYASVGNKPNFLKLMYQYWKSPKIDPQKLVEWNKAIMGFNLIWLYERIDLMNEGLKELEEMDLKPPHVGHVFPFEEAHEAIRLFQSGKTKGKVVLQTKM
ncbi:MAG: zinc-binding dehydrogenase [Saprospiraceae bacterium]|nr:zinc-binding dehydrogenase [Saprospiraceae bacterium]